MRSCRRSQLQNLRSSQKQILFLTHSACHCCRSGCAALRQAAELETLSWGLVLGGQGEGTHVRSSSSPGERWETQQNLSVFLKRSFPLNAQALTFTPVYWPNQVRWPSPIRGVGAKSARPPHPPTPRGTRTQRRVAASRNCPTLSHSV